MQTLAGIRPCMASLNADVVDRQSDKYCAQGIKLKEIFAN